MGVGLRTAVDGGELTQPFAQEPQLAWRRVDPVEAAGGRCAGVGNSEESVGGAVGSRR